MAKKIKINNVRLSFPSLFKTATFGSEDTGKYEATFILDKSEHKRVIRIIEELINDLTKESFKGKSLPDDRVCLKDGDDQERSEFEGKMTIKAATKRRPLVIDRDRTPIVEEDDRMYPGCYVNAIISLWAQDNQWGKRINGSLEGVQFYRDGERFGEAGISVDEFEPIDDEDDI